MPSMIVKGNGTFLFCNSCHILPQFMVMNMSTDSQSTSCPIMSPVCDLLATLQIPLLSFLDSLFITLLMSMRKIRYSLSIVGLVKCGTILILHGMPLILEALLPLPCHMIKFGSQISYYTTSKCIIMAYISGLDFFFVNKCLRFNTFPGFFCIVRECNLAFFLFQCGFWLQYSRH